MSIYRLQNSIGSITFQGPQACSCLKFDIKKPNFASDKNIWIRNEKKQTKYNVPQHEQASWDANLWEQHFVLDPIE